MSLPTAESTFPPRKMLGALIDERGLRKGFVAAKAGIRPDVLSQLLAGTRDLSPYYASRLAPVLGVAMEDLLPRRGET